MKADRTVGIFEISSVVALLIGLGFVWYELHQSKTIAITEGAVAAVEGEIASRSLLLEHADVWRRGCADEELDENERLIFDHLVQSHVFPMFTRWIRHEAGMTDARPFTFTANIASNVSTYPGYRRVWEYLSTRYPTEFKAEIDKLVAGEIGQLVATEQCGL